MLKTNALPVNSNGDDEEAKTIARFLWTWNLKGK